MRRGRILGLDPGERRIGVALSDPLGIIAQPHSVIDRNQVEPFATIRNLSVDNDVSLIVVGLPISLSGQEGRAAEAARSFAEKVADAVECKVEMMDERFTTATAEQALREAGLSRADRRSARDKVAAAVMLQSYLDRTGRDSR